MKTFLFPQRFLGTVLFTIAIVCGLILTSCGKSEEVAKPIVLYTSVDEPYVRPLIQKFTEQTGITVVITPDTEATKSIGLAERLRAEKDKPRCDVWWGNEPFHTANLASEGLFEPYQSPSAADVRDTFKDPQHRWTGNGLRARVIVYQPYFVAAAFPQWKLDFLTEGNGAVKVVMSRPSIGTVGGHIAAIYATRGKGGGDAFFTALRKNGVVLVGGNSVVVQQIAARNFDIGITDNDDVAAVGDKAISTLPDQQEGDIGTLAIPTTVALVKRSDANPDAKKLIDFLLSAETEKALIDAKFAAWSARSTETQFRAMKIDYAEVAKTMPWAVRRAQEILDGKTPAE